MVLRHKCINKTVQKNQCRQHSVKINVSYKYSTDTILSSNVKCFNCLLMSKRKIVGVDERWINLKLSSL